VFFLDTAHFFSPNQLNIAAIAAQTEALGPGTRAAIWVQGCPLNCRGCIAPNWIPFKTANILSIEDVITKLSIRELDGITFSGGEPMEQAEALANLAIQIRRIKDLNLICFTGYRYERLINNPPNIGVKKLLAEVDVLIDGPYVQEKNNSLGLRGSSNQRILHLTSRLKEYDLENQKRKVEVTIADGELAFVGIPTPAIKTALDRARLSEMERMTNHERL
jgi:anaerobic ribonucleoside-triphosphate reductase activating protein